MSVTMTHTEDRSIGFLPLLTGQRHSVTAWLFYHVAALDALKNRSASTSGFGLNTLTCASEVAETMSSNRVK